MTGFHIVIPARYGSSRLPGKPLALIGDQPMVVRTARSVARANPDSLIIATDDSRIVDVVQAAGFVARMTSDQHQSGSDRVLEVAAAEGWQDNDIVINVQGDEPLMPAAPLRQLAAALASSPIGAATLCEPIERREDIFNPNIVKVVRSVSGEALYFSRAPIPWARDSFGAQTGTVPQRPGYFRHIGVYAFRVATLRRFVSLPMSDLEKVEALEQLRLLDNGIPMLVLDSCAQVPGGVDTPEDLARVNVRLSTPD
ncbi:MAG: 3-deoxy-manno-octulosonate cytidylyltransferase [Pseudomonadales bacterium]